MKYCAAYYSDIGIQKETNQDSLLLVQRGQTQDDEAVLAVICDGVGGLKMGERSSAAVVTAFRDWFDERVEELYEQEEPETELFDDWDNLIQSLHIRLKDYSEKAGFRSGTTVEAVLFMKGRYYICHVGDCRTYIISDAILFLRGLAGLALLFSPSPSLLQGQHLNDVCHGQRMVGGFFHFRA